MESYAAIVSSGSRLDARRIADALTQHLANRVDLTLEIVSSSAEATAAARTVAENAKVVVAVGGDGTVADVATGIFGSGAALGIIPAGSTNITARSLGIPANPHEAIAILSEPHHELTIDVGRSGNRCFLHMAGAGLDAEMFRGANREWKQRVGWLAYLPPAAAALRLSPSEVQVTTDDAAIQARSPLILVANGAAAIAPALKLHPHIAVNDGQLDVLVFTAATPAQIAATIGHFGSQRLDQSPHVIWQTTRNLRIDADPRLPVQLDGDTRGSTPREFSLAAAALRVITPP